MLITNYQDKFVKEGLTFDDVLLIPAKSDVVPNEVKVDTILAKDIKLNTPIMTAAMDTVTEAAMAIALQSAPATGGGAAACGGRARRGGLPAPQTRSPRLRPSAPPRRRQ